MLKTAPEPSAFPSSARGGRPQTGFGPCGHHHQPPDERLVTSLPAQERGDLPPQAGAVERTERTGPSDSARLR